MRRQTYPVLPVTDFTPGDDAAAGSAQGRLFGPPPVLPGLRAGVWEQLKPAQRLAVALASDRTGFHLWWACGAGKTRAAVVWACLRRRPTLIITRASVVDQWQGEIAAATTHDPYVYRPISDRRAGTETHRAYTDRIGSAWRGDVRAPVPTIIAGWSAFQSDAAFADLLTWANEQRDQGTRPIIVWDEAHIAKDFRRRTMAGTASGAKEFRPLQTTAARAAKLARRACARLSLTATPIADRRRDLWSQLDITEPGSVGSGPWPWLTEYCGAVQSTYGWVTDKETNTDALLAWLRPRTHVVTSEELWRDLPPCSRDLIVVPPNKQDAPDPAARRALRTAMREASKLRGEAGQEHRRAFAFAEAATRKRSTAVAHAVEELQCGGKVIVFTGLRSDVQALYERIAAAVPQAHGWHAHGGTPPDERAGIRRAYQSAPGPAFLVGTGAAWGESANLHHTTLQIIVSLPWTWGQIRQWEGRARRLGQPWPLRIVYLFAEGTVDDRIFPQVRRKLLQASSLLPDTQIDTIRSTLAGGTDAELIDDLLDSVLTGTLGVTLTADGRVLTGDDARAVRGAVLGAASDYVVGAGTGAAGVVGAENVPERSNVVGATDAEAEQDQKMRDAILRDILTDLTTEEN